MTSAAARPMNLQALRDSGWESKTVKQEIRDNFLRMLQAGDELFPGIVGYENTVIPEINIALIAGHDLLFLGEKGQAKSRLMRSLVRFLDEDVPYLDHPALPGSRRSVPSHHLGRQAAGRRDPPEDQVPIAWWPRDQRYAERLAPGTKFADVIGEIDPAKLAGGTSMAAEEALHFGLIPRMHRGIFAMNEVPELDELVQVGLFNILEERDVQIRGYPIQFDLDVLDSVLGQPGDLQPLRQGHPAAQGPHRLADPDALSARPLRWASRSWSRKPALELGGDYPVAGAVLHEGDHRADQHAAPQVEVRRSAVRRQRPLLDRQLSHDGRQRPPSRRAPGREAGRAAHQRPGPSAIARRWASWNWT